MTSKLTAAAICISWCVILLGIVREVVQQTVGFPPMFDGFRHINLDTEHNIGSWWSSSLMLVSALILLAFSKVEKGRGLYHSTIWLPLAAVFFLLSLDESASFHESLIAPLRGLLNLDGIFYFAWVIPAFFVLIAFGLLILRRFLALPRAIQGQFAAAGIIYVFGALGMELVGGWLTASGQGASAYYSVSIIIEEGMEIIGLTVFFVSLTRQLDSHVLSSVPAFAAQKPVPHREEAHTHAASAVPAFQMSVDGQR